MLIKFLKILLIHEAIGFTSAGVAAGSMASVIQGAIYGGATGGLFSASQAKNFK